MELLLERVTSENKSDELSTLEILLSCVFLVGVKLVSVVLHSWVAEVFSHETYTNGKENINK